MSILIHVGESESEVAQPKSQIEKPVGHTRSKYFFFFFKNSLIIHEENTKKNHKRVVSLYVDKDFPSFT
jgi:hypothetical protein